MSTPFISIIVPCYNAEKYIDTSLGSIMEQSYGNWECIAVNDGSTDQTEDRVKEWLARDVRFKLLSQKNKGPSDARNAGLEKKSGDCVFFLDADDLLAPDCLQQFVNLYQVEVDVVIGRHGRVSSQTSGEVKEEKQFPVTERILSYQDFIALALRNPFGAMVWNNLYSSSFIDTHKLRFKSGIFHEDELWFFETMHLAKKIVFSSKVSYFYNVGNQNSITKNFGLKNLQDYLKVLEHIYDAYYRPENNKATQKIVGTYIIQHQITFSGVFFRYLKKNKVGYKNEGLTLLKKHFNTYAVDNFSSIDTKKSKQFQLFVEYGKEDPEIAFKLMRNTDKNNVLKFFENLYLKFIADLN
ncbi:MAG: glycosyltransferase [Aequorivita sp.]|nr:glycosyltransferase [Aequorivita sp.]